MQIIMHTRSTNKATGLVYRVDLCFDFEDLPGRFIDAPIVQSLDHHLFLGELDIYLEMVCFLGLQVWLLNNSCLVFGTIENQSVRKDKENRKSEKKH